MTIKVKDFFSDAGPVAKRLEGFELRPEQQEMAAAVAAAFEGGRHLMVEAGTGVGKLVLRIWCRRLRWRRRGRRW